MEIRTVGPGDRKTWVELASEFYHTDAVWHPVPETYLEAAFDEMMSGGRYLEGYLLLHNGAAAGYALLAKSFSQEAGGLCLWLEELYLKKEYRGQGAGSEFFDFLDRRADALGAARLRLEVEPDNRRAQKLYRRRGFSMMPYGEMVSERGEKMS